MERYLTYDRLISHHRNRLDVTKFPDDKLNMAYLDNKFNQFLIHLNNFDVELIKKTLDEIFNQLQNGDEVYKYSIDNPEMLDKIYDFLTQYKNEGEEFQSEIIRIKAAKCFKQFCYILKVKEYLDEGKYLKYINKTFDDFSVDVKLNVYQGLIYYSQSRYGIDTLLQNEILKNIIKKIVEEKSLQVIDLILILSNEILMAETAPQIALECEMIKNLKLYLNSEDDKVRENTILNYGSLSLCEQGKKLCVEEGSLIKNILSFLKKESELLPILIASTRFLMSVSILKRGKVEIYEDEGLEVCIGLLDKYEDVQLLLNILQIIGNVSEEPRGRKKMSENHLLSIEKFLQHENRFIKEQAIITRNIITWKP
jgi:ribosomal protein S8